MSKKQEDNVISEERLPRYTWEKDDIVIEKRGQPVNKRKKIRAIIKHIK